MNRENTVSQREALDKMIEIGRNLMESTRDSDVQNLVENALINLDYVRFRLDGDYIKHRDPLLMTMVNGTKVKI